MAVTEAGIALFYHVTTFMNDETKFYPPTRQFFSSCIEILGQVSRPNMCCYAENLKITLMRLLTCLSCLLFLSVYLYVCSFAFVVFPPSLSCHRVTRMTGDFSTPCNPGHLLVRSQSSTFEVSMTHLSILFLSVHLSSCLIVCPSVCTCARLVVNSLISVDLLCIRLGINFSVMKQMIKDDIG